MAGNAAKEQSKICDVLVIGSGAGGLSTAIVAASHGLDVLVVEKSEFYGGASAWSGGWLWVPLNPLAIKAGFKDSIEAVKTYIKHESKGLWNEKRVDAFLESGPEMVAFFQENTALQFDWGPNFPDYRPLAPGGVNGGRSLVAQPYDARGLGKEVRRLLRPRAAATLLGMQLGSGGELQHFYNAFRSLNSFLRVIWLISTYLRDRVLHGRAMRLTNGNALVARLARSAFDRKIPIWTSSPAESLIMEKGVVRGARILRKGVSLEVRARRGVVLASGGFPWDIERRKKAYSHGASTPHWSNTPETNTGDGLRLGEAAGGRQLTELTNAGAWSPVSLMVEPNGEQRPVGHLVDRGKPGFITVLANGRRFGNEADSYHNYVEALIAATPGDAEKTGFLIADHKAVRTYGMGRARPAPFKLETHVKNGYLTQADTIEGLAVKLGVDPAGLQATVTRFNENARLGVDPDFNRGASAYNAYLGDPNHKPNPSLGPIEVGPFYGVKIYPGDLATYATLVVDEDGRVLNDKNLPIQGLYAAGTDAATAFGGSYVGGGAVLGPTLTFGYRTGRHLAGVNAPAPRTPG
ncbi:FAD-dependent oxidoreductase [Phenylobacterium sp.]|uniref:FAD-dependent oxidoreductase n=1 Tax=Phenylobacterium sp. TaxID=1871053 RepID=UPI0035B02C35